MMTRQKSRDRQRPTARQREFIAEKIPILRREGYRQDQAIAIAHRMAGVPERGSQRDQEDAPASSRRGTGRGYRFEVAAALIRNYRMEPQEAFALVRRWGRLVDMRMRERRSPISTAEHIERFQRQRIVSPFPARTARDKRSGARGRGQTRVSQPFRLCAPGTEVQTLIFGPDVTSRQATRWATSHGYRARKVDVTSQSVRVRQRPPSVFQPGSFRTFVLSRKDDVRAVIGCPRPGKESDKKKGGPGRPGSRRSLTHRDPTPS